MSNPHDVGVIHGRFQVLHNDHLNYLLAGKALCRHLVVGITNPSPEMTRDEAADPQRSSPACNPLTYYERARMMDSVLVEAGVSRSDFTMVPLPINMPECYGHFVPLDAVFYLTIYDDWGRRKLRYFEQRNLRTHVLWERDATNKGISATEVRNRMANGGNWESLVPDATARLMRQWNIPARLAQCTEPCVQNGLSSR